LIFGIVFRIFFPKWRANWQFWLSWIVSTIGMLRTLLLGVLDFNSLGGMNWIYFLLGYLAVAIWGLLVLGEWQR
jgi:hypothetical protein